MDSVSDLGLGWSQAAAAYNGNLNPVQEDILAGLLIVIGAVLAFSGEYWFGTLVALIAAVAGGFTTNLILVRVQADISSTVAIVIIVLASVLCGVIALQVKRVGIWLAGALGGLLVSNLVYTMLLENSGLKDSDIAHVTVIVLCAVIGGTLLSWLERPLERVITSFVGGYLVIAGVSHILLRTETAKSQPFWPTEFFGDLQHFECKGDKTCGILLLTWLGLFVVGVVAQTAGGYVRDRRQRDGYEQL